MHTSPGASTHCVISGDNDHSHERLSPCLFSPGVVRFHPCRPEDEDSQVSKRDTGVLLVVKDGIQLMITIATPMAILTAVLLSAASPACSGGSSQGTSAFGPPLASCETAVLQTPFAVNCGQAAEPVRFCAHIPGGAVLISDMGEVRYRAFRNDEETAQAVLTETLSGGLLNRVIQTRRTDVVIHYFRGNDSSKWITGIPTYGTLDFGEVYEGIRCELDVREGRLIRRFVLQPGTDPGRIRVRVDGEAVVLKTCPNGRIEAGAGPRSVLASRVTAVENRDGERVSVEIDYWVDGTEYGFGVGAYDSRYPLVIESAVDLPGGSRISSRPPVETGADKPQYILGGAPSLVRHSTAGAPLESMRGDLDVWIARFDADSGTPRAVAFVAEQATRSRNALTPSPSTGPATCSSPAGHIPRTFQRPPAPSMKATISGVTYLSSSWTAASRRSSPRPSLGNGGSNTAVVWRSTTTETCTWPEAPAHRVSRRRCRAMIQPTTATTTSSCRGLIPALPLFAHRRFSAARGTSSAAASG